MKILKIEFENLNSLRGVQTIDLESGDLAEAGIFAITGPTGAGKSTILDAITLALYGRAARYGSSPSPENMMSRHTGFCRSEIIFETPAGRFRSAWLLNRARKNPDGKVQPAKHQVFDQNETPLTQKIKETAEKIEELIGLDFDRFLRSVLLAQGEFAKFLKSDVNERSRLLESLTGTSIYSDLSQLVYEQHKDREGQLKQREAKLDAVVLLTADELKEKQTQSKSLGDELKSLKKKLKAVTERVELGKQLRTANESKQKLAAAMKSLEERGKAQAADEQRLKSHQKALAFKPDLGKIDQQRTQSSNANNQVRLAVTQTETSGQTLKLQLEHASSWLADRNQQLLKELDAESKQQTVLTDQKTQAKEWLTANAADQTLAETIPNLRTGLAELTASRRNGAEATASLKKLAGMFEKAEDSLKQTKKDLDSLRATIKKEQGTLSKQQELLAKELDGADPKSLNEQRDRLTEKIAALSSMAGQQVEVNELKLAIDAKQTAIKQQQADTQLHQGKLEKATEAVQGQEETCAALELAVEQARLVAELTEHRANLKDGEACPLCGALEHPAVDGGSTSPLATMQNELGKGRNALKKLTATQLTQSEQLALAKATLQTQQNEITNEQERLAKQKQNLNQQATKLKLSAEEAKDLATTRSTAESQLQTFKQRMSQVDALRESVQTCEQTVQQSSGKQDLLTQSLTSTEANLGELKTQQAEATKQLEATNIDVQRHTTDLNELLEKFQLTTPEPPAVEAFQQSLDQRNQAYQTRTKKLTTLESQLTESQRSIKDIQLAQQGAGKAAEQVATWTNEEALRSVTLPAAADTKETATWANEIELTDQLRDLHGKWQQAVDREQDRKNTAAELSKTFTEASAAFLARVVQGGFESIDRLQSQLLTDDAAEKIADGLEQHKAQLNKTQGQLEQLETTLKSLQEKSAPDEKQMADLETEVEQRETETETQQRELATVENELKTDRQQREHQAEVQQALQAERQQLATWQRLSEMIGSADGKKFRTFAQGISLDLVIGHANKHLTELSKRYRLQRRAADSLGLEICDLHQANTLRPMESLSGGESFVVSLALALGLSDLAGQSVRIDSLFIDEGFGTLDPETLDMAVAALERLQARNKTIGVISHVELLKERITTQIQVHPIAEGNSELRIVA